MLQYEGESKAALDQFVAPGLRLWMLIALVASVLLFLIIIVCCFIKIRIPRTKRQIEAVAERRRLRQLGSRASGGGGGDTYDERRGQPPIVMGSLGPRAADDAANGAHSANI